MQNDDKNEVLVIVDNAINSKTIPELTQQEYDLLFYSLGKLKEKGDRKVKIPAKELRNSLGARKWGNQDIYKTTDSLWEKVSKIKYTAYNEKGEPSGGAILFSSLFMQDGEITVGINPELLYMTNNFEKGNYLSFPIKKFADIKGKYGKALYKMLVQWKSQGTITYTPDQLFDFLEFPESYMKEKKKIKSQVLNPALKAIGGAIPDLQFSVNLEYGGTVESYKFTWNANDFVEITKIQRKDVTPKYTKRTRRKSYKNENEEKTVDELQDELQRMWEEKGLER